MCRVPKRPDGKIKERGDHMRYAVLVALALLLSGCDIIAPQVEKSRTEKRQLTVMQRQVVALERIAAALESHTR